VKREEVIAALKEIERLVSACLAGMGEGPSPNAKPATMVISPRRATRALPDFTAPIRHFMKQHAQEMNGQQRFTLMLAYLSKGKPNTEIKLETIRNAWSGMKGLLGKFNTGYATWAKDHGWVDSPKARVYVLRPGWTEILDQHA
jgi:hypothetical protein